VLWATLRDLQTGRQMDLLKEPHSERSMASRKESHLALRWGRQKGVCWESPRDQPKERHLARQMASDLARCSELPTESDWAQLKERQSSEWR
jgi:hypothetical protein